MQNRLYSICNRLVQSAQDSMLLQKLSASILQNKKIVNKPKENGIRTFYRGEFNGSIHAEMNVLLSHFGEAINYDKKIGWRINDSERKKIKKYAIIVIRIDKRDKDSVQLMNARPCQNCLNMMKSIGLKKVYYSDDKGDIVCEQIKNMVSIHTSHVTIKINSITKNKEEVSKQKLKQNYFDESIRRLPDIIKKGNFLNFINYDYKTISHFYQLESSIIKEKNGYFTKFIFTNINNEFLKAVIVF